ncbi:hypothetical protein LTR37_008935 [Vermiconidia calcicola]|uniref:Uncharacterized protein n=1 Tax=Vermiconidia calcicola TaxID=1690605 RepID=A0ACC3NAP7_9PEZI|nr:hypothetical protein LTR37_008935 [Vermiconidia calcicola]
METMRRLSRQMEMLSELCNQVRYWVSGAYDEEDEDEDECTNEVYMFTSANNRSQTSMNLVVLERQIQRQEDEGSTRHAEEAWSQKRGPLYELWLGREMHMKSLAHMREEMDSLINCYEVWEHLAPQLMVVIANSEWDRDWAIEESRKNGPIGQKMLQAQMVDFANQILAHLRDHVRVRSRVATGMDEVSFASDKSPSECMSYLMDLLENACQQEYIDHKTALEEKMKRRDSKLDTKH